jgi:xanthine dehydrogenase accessory factor
MTVQSANPADHLQLMAALSAAGTAFVQATLVAVRGSAPQTIGAKVIVTEQGLLAGTIGGGKIEARVIAQARDWLSQPTAPQNQFVTWHLQDDVGMTCGGEVSIFFERFGNPAWCVVVFGAGHVAQALIPLLLTLETRVVCVDQRQEWLEKLPRHVRLQTHCLAELGDFVPQIPAQAFVLLMTQGHAVDYPILSAIMRRGRPPFLGMIGSVGKAERVRRELRTEGFSAEDIAHLISPLGLPFGNNTPPEIAISMAAQLLQFRDQMGLIPQKSKRFRPRLPDASR